MIQSPIKSDESLIFFPTYGTLDEAAAMWRANVHGWIYERSLLGGIALVSFRAGLDLPFQPETDALFLQRAWAFSVDNERGKAIPIVFDLNAEPERVTLAESTANGHFNDVVELPRDHVRDVLGNDIAHVKYHAVVRNGDDRAFSGQVRLLPPQGISVISDIDDTIKISDVTDRSELLRNTFLRPFQPVPDIAARYTAWHDEAPADTGFHYVTAAPWQLFSPLTGFLSESAFPDGIMHMKLFRPKDSTFWDLFKEQTVYKTEIIGRIFRDFPGRKFVLVGDSGEQDPEVYGAIARKYPRQVEAIMIRNLTGLDAADERFVTAFAKVPDGTWRLFTDAGELPESLAEFR